MSEERWIKESPKKDGLYFYRQKEQITDLHIPGSIILPFWHRFVNDYNVYAVNVELTEDDEGKLSVCTFDNDDWIDIHTLSGEWLLLTYLVSIAKH